MADIQEETINKIRRSLGQEIARAEDDFDETRIQRKRLTDKLVQAAATVKIVDVSKDENGQEVTVVREDSPVAIALTNTALKALEATEKAANSAAILKLRNKEQETASAAAHQDRIAVVLQATRPGIIKANQFAPEALEEKLAEMFDAEIKDFELKTNPDDLTE